MPSVPYWQTPVLSYATLTLRRWSKPTECEGKCPPPRPRASTCGGIVPRLPYPDAVQ